MANRGANAGSSAHTSQTTVAGDEGDTTLVIQSGEDDFAVNRDGSKLEVGIPNRRKIQKIWIRSLALPGSKTATLSNATYDPDTQSPEASNKDPGSLILTREEIEGRADTMEVLIVGLLKGDKDPQQYSMQGSGMKKSKERMEEFKDRVLITDAKAMYVVTPVTEYPSGQTKLYVCHEQSEQLRSHIGIAGNYVFFFKEYITEEAMNLKNKKKAYALIITEVKKWAAKQHLRQAQHMEQAVEETND